jgi:transcriptional regulator with XRE-family HTH domain
MTRPIVQRPQPPDDRWLEEIMAAEEHHQSGIAMQMERRRKALGMSRSALARRSGVSLPTVNRIFGGGWQSATYANLEAIANALGMDFELTSTIDVQDFAEHEAQAKAEAIARMVQGTSALESQAVGPDTRRQIVKQTVHELMAGSRRRLWSPR